MMFSRLALLAVFAGSAQAFTFRAEPCTLAYGKNSVVDMVSSYLDQLSAKTSVTQPYTPAVRAPEPPKHSGYQAPPPVLDSAAMMGSYLDALGSTSYLNNSAGGMSIMSYLSNIGGPNTHLNKPRGANQAMAGYLQSIPRAMERRGGAGLLGYVDSLGSQPIMSKPPVASSYSAPAAPAVQAAPKKSSGGMSAYDQQMAAAYAAAKAKAAPAAPVAAAPVRPAAPAPVYAKPQAPKSLKSKPVAASSGLLSFTDRIPISSYRMAGAGVVTYVDVLPITQRLASGGGVVTHVDTLASNSGLRGGAGILSYTDSLKSAAAFTPSKPSAPATPAYSAPPKSNGMSAYDQQMAAALAAAQAKAAPAKQAAPAELGRGFASFDAQPKRKGTGIGSYLDSL